MKLLKSRNSVSTGPRLDAIKARYDVSVRASLATAAWEICAAAGGELNNRRIAALWVTRHVSLIGVRLQRSSIRSLMSAFFHAVSNSLWTN